MPTSGSGGSGSGRPPGRPGGLGGAGGYRRPPGTPGGLRGSRGGRLLWGDGANFRFPETPLYTEPQEHVRYADLPPAPTPENQFWVPGFSQAGAYRRHRVAIFGAGIGGLTAAQELAERGFKVHVFDMGGESQAGGLAASQWHVSSRIPAAYGALYTDLRVAGDPGFGGEATIEAAPVPPVFQFPAEHGFRFFPSFYTHVIDTMRRIPLWDRQTLDLASLKAFAANPSDEQFVADMVNRLNNLQNPPGPTNPLTTGTTVGGATTILDVVTSIVNLLQFRGQVDFFRAPFVVASNLVPTNKTGLVFDDGRVLEYDRRIPRSQWGTFSATFLFELFGLGHETRDMAHLFARMFQYLTSCRERRLAEYEKMTFWDFMQADRVSPTLQQHLDRFTRLLLAMDARRGEARTVLNVLVRMILDQGSQGLSTDRVLNGPTTERWIVPWVRYLRQCLDVTFHWCTQLTRFQVTNGRVTDAYVKRTGTDDSTALRLTPWLTEEVRAASGAESADDSLTPPPFDPGVLPVVSEDGSEGGGQQWNYFVADLPVRGLWRVLQNSPGLLVADEAETAAQPPRCFPRDNPDPPLSAISNLVGDDCNPPMSGIQFYLSDPIDLGVPGHMNFVDSKWALTAIVQSQFWGPDFVTRYGNYVVRAILSVDIADFDVPGESTGGLTLRQLAAGYTADPRGVSDKIAAEVWHQMAKGLRGWNVRLPDPERVVVNGQAFPIPLPYLDHHIDWTICGCNPACDPSLNTPAEQNECLHPTATDPAYFIATPDSWRHRPGPLPPYDDSERGYRVRLGTQPDAYAPGGLLVAGVYAQSFTSLNSMEAANESARHAVNGLLAHASKWREANHIEGGAYRYEACSIWPMEELEPADFESGKQVDSRLFSLCDPHAFEIQGMDKVVDYFTQICNVQNRAFSPGELQQKFKEVLWTLSAFGRYDPF